MWRLKQNKEGKWYNNQIKMCEHCSKGLQNEYKTHILSFGEDFDGKNLILLKNVSLSTT